ncbi:tyrosine-type recombinase/integrase [Hungatella sp.]|uniref:site-specific integrase n=1 Tax=Hungatella sp. TaxID=2613924 RepID=UPI002A810548|nr:tyrosine-type recombinase/integrase [Hungatella sp.]
MLGGLYGMRRSELLGLCWQNVDLKNNTFDVVEQLPFHVPPKTMVIEEMAPPKSNSRTLPITELARPFFEKQLALLASQKEAAQAAGKPYYENDLVVCKANGAPQAANWISSGFGKLLESLEMPRIRFHDLRHTAATNMHQLTGDFYTVGEVLGHTLAGIGASLGMSMNFEAVTARYVDVRLERKKEVLK